MKNDIVKDWQAFSVRFEAWLRDNTGSPPISKLGPLIMPPGVIKRFSGADGVASWDGARNMTTPLQPHSFRDVNDPPELMPYGHPSMASEIRPGDPQWSVDVRSGKPKRRVECSWSKWRFPLNEDGWAGGAFLLPSDPMRTNPGTSIFQLHFHPDSSDMAQIHLRKGRLKLTSDGPGTNTDLMDIPLAPFLDKWSKMVVNFRAATDDTGFIKLWLDDEQVVDYTGRTKSGDGIEGAFFKHGGYFWAYGRNGKKRALVYHDRLRIADRTGSYASVDPDRW